MTERLAGAGAGLSPGALPGWNEDDHQAAQAAFLVTSDVAAGPARAFWEQGFQAVELAGDWMFTGYYEPELPARSQPDARFRHPVYRLPEGLPQSRPWFSRAEITAGDMLRGQEIAWLDDPLEAFLLQVQGSGRLVLEDGRVLRLGYGGRNGHPYVSIGRQLVLRGEIPLEAMSTEAIRDWARRNPDRLTALLNANPSYVFFRVLNLPPETGPLGAMEQPLTAGRSLAVDPTVVPLGAAVWVMVEEMARLMVAQDTGSAIKGPRGDIFFGSGVEAGRRAGRLRHSGRAFLLLPREG
ncbi:murein transglycosylase [Haematobacter massiliensis]|uniref:murein transglycosylase A n=1 Tax=Haematobacter massiliensis TaxID=195105 RepID=UPI000A028648|nr:MltA domain-containing protein [Haematobacter massiliensis]OWJ69978.1 murein transglycosylase [Haematobacter massiliensis]OWJ87137.1 murein transglycosylase [Haematobacter massiliensis]QBJ25213.1 murein transglycosylase [Haematobacter massiliensis]